MNRLSDSKALISLISVIFILLMGMAMTGCAVPRPMSDEYRDPLAGINLFIFH
jgi:hypothetical protein